MARICGEPSASSTWRTRRAQWRKARSSGAQKGFQKLNFLNISENFVKKVLQNPLFLQSNAYKSAKKSRNFARGIEFARAIYYYINAARNATPFYKIKRGANLKAGGTAARKKEYSKQRPRKDSDLSVPPCNGFRVCRRRTRVRLRVKGESG